MRKYHLKRAEVAGILSRSLGIARPIRDKLLTTRCSDCPRLAGNPLSLRMSGRTRAVLASPVSKNSYADGVRAERHSDAETGCMWLSRYVKPTMISHDLIFYVVRGVNWRISHLSALPPYLCAVPYQTKGMRILIIDF